MSTSNGSDFIQLEDKDDVFEEILTRIPVLCMIIDKAPSEEKGLLKAQLVSALRFTIKQMADHPVNQPEGGTAILVRDRHINLNKLLLSSAELGVNVLVVIVTAPSGGVGGLMMLPSVISTIARLPEIMNKLDQSELQVLKTALEIIARKQKTDENQDGATQKEIEKAFQERNVEPPDVEGILEVLTEEKHVMVSKRQPDGTKIFKIVR